MAVNLHPAHKKSDSRAAHKALLARASYHRAVHKLLLTCSTQKITRIQYTKFDLHVAHFVSHPCFDSSHDKN